MPTQGAELNATTLLPCGSELDVGVGSGNVIGPVRILPKAVPVNVVGVAAVSGGGELEVKVSVLGTLPRVPVIWGMELLSVVMVSVFEVVVEVVSDEVVEAVLVEEVESEFVVVVPLQGIYAESANVSSCTRIDGDDSRSHQMPRSCQPREWAPVLAHL